MLTETADRIPFFGISREIHDSIPRRAPSTGLLNGRVVRDLNDITALLKKMTRRDDMCTAVCSWNTCLTALPGLTITGTNVLSLLIGWLINVSLPNTPTYTTTESSSPITYTDSAESVEALTALLRVVMYIAISSFICCLLPNVVLTALSIGSGCRNIYRYRQRTPTRGRENLQQEVEKTNSLAKRLKLLGPNELTETNDLKKYVKTIHSCLSICHQRRITMDFDSHASTWIYREIMATKVRVSETFSSANFTQLGTLFQKLDSIAKKILVTESLTDRQLNIFNGLHDKILDNNPWTLRWVFQHLVEEEVFQQEPELLDTFIHSHKAIIDANKNCNASPHANDNVNNAQTAVIFIVVGDRKISIEKEKAKLCDYFRSRMEQKWKDRITADQEELPVKDVNNEALFVKMIKILNTGKLNENLDLKQTAEMLSYADSYSAIPVIALCQKKMLELLRFSAAPLHERVGYLQSIVETVPVSNELTRQTCAYYTKVCQEYVALNNWETVRDGLGYAYEHAAVLQQFIIDFNPKLAKSEILPIHIKLAFEFECCSFSTAIKKHFERQAAMASSPLDLLTEFKAYRSYAKPAEDIFSASSEESLNSASSLANESSHFPWEKSPTLISGCEWKHKFYSFLVSLVAKNIRKENFKAIREYAVGQKDNQLQEAYLDYAKENLGEISSLWQHEEEIKKLLTENSPRCDSRVLVNSLHPSSASKPDWDNYLNLIIAQIPSADKLARQESAYFYFNKVCQGYVQREKWETVVDLLSWAGEHPEELNQLITNFNAELDASAILPIHIEIAFTFEECYFSKRIKKHFEREAAIASPPLNLLTKYHDDHSAAWTRKFYTFLVSQVTEHIREENFKAIRKYAIRKKNCQLQEVYLDYAEKNKESIAALWPPNEMPGELAQLLCADYYPADEV